MTTPIMTGAEALDPHAVLNPREEPVPHWWLFDMAGRRGLAVDRSRRVLRSLAQHRSEIAQVIDDAAGEWGDSDDPTPLHEVLANAVIAYVSEDAR